jgi:hypothetical protein
MARLAGADGEDDSRPFGIVIPAARASRGLPQDDLLDQPLHGGGLYHPRRFLFRRHPAVRRELIDKPRQMLAQSGQQVVAIHPALS